MRDGRWHQDDLSRLQFHNAAFAFDLGSAGELEVDQIMIRRPGELLLKPLDVLSRYPQAVAFPDRCPSAVSGARRAAEQVEWSNLRHHSLSHASGANNGAFISFNPNVFIRIPVRHKLSNFFRHTLPP